jgi:F-type H+-transporting ATPase subunit delta
MVLKQNLMTPETQDAPFDAAAGRSRLARVYAEALYAAAAKRQQADAVGDELEAFARDVVAKNSKVEAFLASAAVGRKAKAPLLAKATDGRASDVFRNFLGVLNQHDRLGLIRSIAAAYRDMRDQLAGRARIKVRAAAPLPDDQQAALKTALGKMLNKEPVLDVHVEPDLLGGMIVQVGDTVYDTTIRTRMAALRTQLLARGSYEIQSRRDRFRTG